MNIEARVARELPSQWPTKILLAEPRGFCAGVVRSVEAYRQLLRDHPNQTIYSVGEPAHNTHVNNEFRQQGMIFVDNVEDVKRRGKAALGPHGSTPSDLHEAKERGLTIVDTQCPLVTKVHREIAKNEQDGYTTIYFGKRGHPETRGVLGLGESIILVESKEELLKVEVPNPEKVAFNSQTTHAANKALEMQEIVLKRFPDARVPKKEDVCYATQNRQDAVREIINQGAEAVVVVGSPHSSNSKELSNVAREAGAKIVFFIDSVKELVKEAFCGINCVGLTSGASVPEDIFQEVVSWFKANGSSQFNTVSVADESRTQFLLPKVQKL